MAASWSRISARPRRSWSRRSRPPEHEARQSHGALEWGASTKVVGHFLAERTQNARERFDTRHNIDNIHIARGGDVTNRLERSQLTRIERDADTRRTHVNHYTSRLDEAEGPLATRRAIERSGRDFTRSGGPAELFESSHRWQKGQPALRRTPLRSPGGDALVAYESRTAIKSNPGYARSKGPRQSKLW
jgi:hypothetical protein